MQPKANLYGVDTDVNNVNSYFITDVINEEFYYRYDKFTFPSE